MSPRSIYLRFFARLKALSPEMLHSLTHVDHDRDVVLVATQRVAGRERALGVFRLMCSPDLKEGELAIAVGGPWHGKGVGAELFRGGLSIARTRRTKSVCAIVMPENGTVLNVARKLGFTVRWNAEDCAYDLRKDIGSADGQSTKTSAASTRTSLETFFAHMASAQTQDNAITSSPRIDGHKWYPVLINPYVLVRAGRSGHESNWIISRESK